MLTDTTKDIRDYCREELEKVREEMQQFAKVLDDRFGTNAILIDGAGSHARNSPERVSTGAHSIKVDLAIENLKDELFKLKERSKKQLDDHKEDIDQVVLKLIGHINNDTNMGTKLGRASLEALKAGQDIGPNHSGKVSSTKQETIVNILVRIEMLENDIRTLKNTSGLMLGR